MFSTACVWIGAGTRMREWPLSVDYLGDERVDDGVTDNGDGDDDDDDDGLSVALGDDVQRHRGPDEYYVEVDVDEERDDDHIVASDVLLLSANSDNEAHSLVVTVFDDIDELSWYNHHDYFLPALPLCVEWLDLGTAGDDGSFAAVGSRHSDAIEVWNLDVMNAIEVAWTLGDAAAAKTRNSVIGLAWNPLQRKLLASGSTDRSLSLWDVRRPAAPVYTSAAVHAGGVQALAWNPASDSQLLSAGFDSVALLHDARSPAAPVCRAALAHEPECVDWLGGDAPLFVVSEEKGCVQVFDARNAARPLCSFEAHAAPHAVTGLSVTHVPSTTHVGSTATIVATCSTDGAVLLWNMSRLESTTPPALVHRRQTGVRCCRVESVVNPNPLRLLFCSIFFVRFVIWFFISSDAVVLFGFLPRCADDVGVRRTDGIRRQQHRE
jgi:WD40 repeat protein